MPKKSKITLLLLLVTLFLKSSGQQFQSDISICDSHMQVVLNSFGITEILSPKDIHRANIVKDTWGNPAIIYKIAQGDWLDFYKDETRVEKLPNGVVKYLDSLKGVPLTMEQLFTIKNGVLDWRINIETSMNFPVIIGDLCIPFSWNDPVGEDPEYIFNKTFTKHHFISGDGSFLYFTKPSGEPPYLVITVDSATKLEYFDDLEGSYKVYIHSAHAGKVASLGTWRQEHTSLDLNPCNESGNKVSYGIKIQWADSWDEMRQILYNNNLFDTRIIPGMTIPRDLTAKISLHTKNQIDSITCEFPTQTRIINLEKVSKDHHLYEVSFRKLGENMLTIHYNGGNKTYLEFFSTEPIETLIKKRSSFITQSQQHQDSSKWYNGLYSIYDMNNSVLRGPDNTDGYDYWWGYVLSSDDPALCKAPFVAAKNVYYPDTLEIASLEYYLKNFVWGGLQRTDTEDPYPYGIYGTPNWMVNRDSTLRAGVKNRNLDKMNIWRSYDYPHMIMLYYHMYQIAKMYPQWVNYLDSEGYLERAWQTARAYFVYPYQILPWYETYKWGCYNELIIEDLIYDLEKNNRSFEANWLRAEYEKKVKYFIYDDKYPYRSEYSIDRTAFESSYTFAKYGVLNEMKPDTNLWFDKKIKKWYSHPKVSKDDALAFMMKQNNAGLAVRGWLETQYYMLGSDFTNSSDRHCLSYMSRMGGWSILDYAIHFADDYSDFLQLGYASYLASFALMNTGDEDSNYGFWSPGKINDGAMGWAFMSSKHALAWNRKSYNRGAWSYDGEADLGNGAIFRTASTILSMDPIFGWVSYGGKLTLNNNLFNIIPFDGVRNKFFIVNKGKRIGIELDHDGFKAASPIIVSKGLNKILTLIENRSGDSHDTRIFIYQDKLHYCQLFLDDSPVSIKFNNGMHYADLNITKKEHKLKLLVHEFRGYNP